jgi:hypothetical protein
MTEYITHREPGPCPCPICTPMSDEVRALYERARNHAREWLDNLDPMFFDGHKKQLMFDAYIAGWTAGKQSQSEAK